MQKHKERNTIKELVTAYNASTAEERAFFAVEALSSMLIAIEMTYGHHVENEEAHPLKLHRNGEELQASVDGIELKNGDILDLVVGVPETWLPIWIEKDRTDRVVACMAARRFDLEAINQFELTSNSYLRWPSRPSGALKRFVKERMELLQQQE